MFFIISKVIPPLLYPLPVFFLGILFILIFYRWKGGRRLLLAMTVALYLCSIPLTSGMFMSLLESPPVPESGLKERYDAVVVLSGVIQLHRSTLERVECQEGIDRLLAGIRMVKEGRADRLLLSGGSGSLFRQDVKEALLMRKLAMDAGVESDRILVETASRNTVENARETAALMKRENLHEVLLITSSFHMRRSLACFEKQGVRPDVYPVDFRSEKAHGLFKIIPSAYSLFSTTTVVREILGLAAYRLQGHI